MASWWIKNLVGAPGSLALPNAYSAGNAFHCEVDGEVQKIGIRKLGAGDTLSGLAIWRMSDQAQILRVVSGLPTSGAADWLEYTLPDPLELIAGQEYRVVADWNGAVNCATWSYSVVPSHPDGTLSKLAGGMGVAAPTGLDAYPSALDSGNAYNTDLFVQQTGVPGGEEPPTNFDIENALARWFSANDDNTRQEHLPWLTKAVIDTIASTQATHTGALAGILTKIGGSTGTNIPTLINNLAASVATSLAVQAVLDAITGLFGSPADPDHSGVTIENIRAQQLLEAGTRNTPHHQPGWVLEDTLVGSGSVLWVQPADVYEFTMTDIGGHVRHSIVVGAGQIINWRGWAKPWDGTFWYPEHQQINGPDCVIRSGQRWPGIGMWVPSDVEWALAAYIFTGA